MPTKKIYNSKKNTMDSLTNNDSPQYRKSNLNNDIIPYKTSYLNTITILSLLLLLPIAIVGGYYLNSNQTNNNDTYNHGFTDGLVAGNETGYETGLEFGQNLGFSLGNESGYLQGLLDGNYTGFILGTESGYDVGFTDGNRSGFDIGFNTGNETGYLIGLMEGANLNDQNIYELGWSIGNSSGYLEGLQIGYNIGINEGNQSGFIQGFNEGFNIGNETGFILGNQMGFIFGNETGFLLGNDTGYLFGNETGFLFGNETGYYFGNASGFLLGNQSGFDLGSAYGYLIGETNGIAQGIEIGYQSGYAIGFTDGYNQGIIDGELIGFDNGFNYGYNEGYNVGSIDAFLNNRITFNGTSIDHIDIYNDEFNSIGYSNTFTNIRNDSITSIPIYTNNSASIEINVENFIMYNDTIIQDTFIDNNANASYTASTTTTLYQQFTLINNASLYKFNLTGLSSGNARLNISLFESNNGIVGNRIAILRLGVVDLLNTLQMVTTNCNLNLTANNYFLGIKTTKGSFRLVTSQGTGINNYISLIGSIVTPIDYAINYSISPLLYGDGDGDNYMNYVQFYPNTNSTIILPITEHIDEDLEEGDAYTDFINLIFPTLTINVNWQWSNLKYDLVLDIIFNYESETTLNTTIAIQELALYNNQSTNFYGSSQEDIIYYTTTNLMIVEFEIKLNEFAFSLSLAQNHIFEVGHNYEFIVSDYNATIYATNGTTWICNFEMWYSINGESFYTQIHQLYLFEVFRN